MGFKKTKSSGPMDAALDYLTSKARTRREMEMKLDSMDFGEYEVYQTVERLIELDLINDEKYACDFVASRLASKPISRRRLREQLYDHKLSPEAIETALAAVSDETENENATAVAEKFARQFERLESDEQRKFVMRRLLARGFDTDTSKYALERVFGDPNVSDDCFEDDGYED